MGQRPLFDEQELREALPPNPHPPEFIVGDSLDVLRDMDSNSVDLVFGSPPYENARSYGIDFSLRGDEWVQWALDRYLECYRVSRGLVAWVVGGTTTNYRYSATPEKLMVALDLKGVRLRRSVIFVRQGVPGGGNADWLRNDYEPIICASKGRLPWSEPTAMGQPCKYKRGGAMTNRKRSGQRTKTPASRRGGGGRPEITNPGNVIECPVGKGHMGSDLATENEAPFPQSLAEFFVRSFCPPDGTVLDPFCGSGTTLAMAQHWGRHSIGIDIRPGQIELSRRRCEDDLRTNGRASD
jgi:DNA modification methylase